MSRYFVSKYDSLIPYVPGEQPQDRKYIKLNTNESPFPPSPRATAMAADAAERLNLYPDPECRELRRKASAALGVPEDCIVFTNGSDEILYFAFLAFCDESHPAAFPDITYGFYPVFADLLKIPYDLIPLAEDLSVTVSDYTGISRTIFLANPNAPTGKLLPVSEIEKIVASNPDSVIIVDEAYIDFGGETCVPLTGEYENLLVTRTFSKSRSMAGARLGIGIGSEALIRDINTLRYSTNPYNVNAMTMAAGIGALEDEEYFLSCCRDTAVRRDWTAEELRALGFRVTDSMANFVFASSPKIPGEDLYLELKKRGILVRHFSSARIRDYVRITIGDEFQMQALLGNIKEILEERS